MNNVHFGRIPAAVRLQQLSVRDADGRSKISTISGPVCDARTGLGHSGGGAGALAVRWIHRSAVQRRLSRESEGRRPRLNRHRAAQVV